MKCVLTILCLIIFAASPFSAQVTEISEIQTIRKRIASLYQNGKIDEAIEVSEKALKLAEKTNAVDFALMSAGLVSKKKRFEKILHLFLFAPKI